MPVRVVTIDEPEIRELFGSGLALVRPDQVLAWHADAGPRDPDAVLDVITGRSTCEPTDALAASARDAHRMA
jgi:hypothetical protein